ncbi:MAG: cation transporter [Pseudobdellovibrionaceae bacterium]|nr:cation transporter [Bdellovibrionales bacterium]USN47166.1 MAG: cation transporter [Pseudobdellovibrionaceae bacterium]
MGVISATLSPKEKKNRTTAAVLSLIVGILLMLVKFWAHNMTKSQAIFSDALESIVNVTAAGLAFLVMYYSARPADEDHPYGHGKVEFFSAAFEGGLITFAGVFIVIESLQAFLAGSTLHRLSEGLYIVAAAGVANLLLGLFLLRTAKRNSSVALRASGHHVISDFWTSVGIILGLIVVKFTEIFWLDPVIAALVGLSLSYQGFKLVRSSAGGLLDEEDPEAMQQLVEIFSKYSTGGIIQIHNVKMIRSGWYHHIDAHVVLPEFWNTNDVHENLLAFENKVIANYEYGGEMNFHADPCRRAYCRVCDLKDCPVRKEAFQERMAVSIEQLRSKDEPDEFRKKKIQ